MKRTLTYLSALSILEAALAAYAAEESSWGQIKAQWNGTAAPLPAAKVIPTPGGTFVFISEGEDFCIFGGRGTGFPSISDGTGVPLPATAPATAFDHWHQAMRPVPKLDSNGDAQTYDIVVFSFDDFQFVETAQGNFKITCRWDLRKDAKCAVPDTNPGDEIPFDPGIFDCGDLDIDPFDPAQVPVPLIPDKARNVVFDDPGQRFHLNVTPAGKVTATSFVNPSAAPAP